MKINSIFADRENHPDIPRRFALRRPVQAVPFALGQGDRWSIEFGAGSNRWSAQFGAANDRRKVDVEQRRKGIEVAEACMWICVVKLGRERNDSNSGRGAVQRDA